MLLWLKLAFAGLGALIWHWGIGVGLIVIILALEVLSDSVPVIGPYLGRFRKDLLWIAAGIALVLVGEYVGARDMQNRCAAQAAAIDKAVNRAVTGATVDPGTDRWDTDQ